MTSKKEETRREAIAEAARTAFKTCGTLQEVAIMRGQVDLIVAGPQQEARQRIEHKAEKVGGRPVELVCPGCGEADKLGTNEKIAGTAWATFTRTAAGDVDVEHKGDTEVYWDCSDSDGYFCGHCCSEGPEAELITPDEYAEREAAKIIASAIVAAIRDASSEPLTGEEIADVAELVAKHAGAAWRAVAEAAPTTAPDQKED